MSTQINAAHRISEALATVETGMQELIEDIHLNGLDADSELAVVEAIEGISHPSHRSYGSLLLDSGFEAIDQVPELLDTTESDVQRLVASGTLRSYRIEGYGTTFVPISQIDQLKSNSPTSLAKFDIHVAVTLLGAGSAA
jgi:hypothetical protein